MAALRAHAAHRFIADDVSICDSDVPRLAGHRQVTDAHLLTLARRQGMPLVTFDGGLAGNSGVQLLSIG
jgi:predicted nucleic acid-binding protein